MSGLKLTDLAAGVEYIDFRGQKTPISAIPGHIIVGLAFRFPHAAALYESGKDADLTTIVGMIGDSLGTVLAAALGHADDPEWEAAALGLPFDEQMDILEAAIRVTMPKGIGPLLERLPMLIASLGLEKGSATDG